MSEQSTGAAGAAPTDAALRPGAPAGEVQLTAAVVVCAYTERRWDDLLDAIDSVVPQLRAGDELVVVIDHNDALLARLRAARPALRIIPNVQANGLSGARNTGVDATSAEVVVFLDDDATAEPDFLVRMLAPMQDPTVQGTGGWAEPAWPASGRPGWFPESFLWVVGCSYQSGASTDRPAAPVPVRNPLGCAMAIRRPALRTAGGFSGAVGRVGTHPVGCEETELCIRIGQADPTARFLMEPTAVVHHHVTDDRTRFKYFRSRCYWEGVSKAVVSKAVGAGDALSAERGHAAKVLPLAALQAFGSGLRGERAGFGRAAAIVGGLAFTVAGYARGLLATPTATPPGATQTPAEDQEPSGRADGTTAEQRLQESA